MDPRALPLRLRTLALITLLCWTWPTGALGQGYKSGARNSPINEAGVKPCDYWDENDHTDASGTRTIKHADGTVVVKRPNQAPAVTRPRRSSEGIQLEQKVWLVGKRFRDDKDGSLLTFQVWDLIYPIVTMYGQWALRSGMQGQITSACFEPDQNRGDGRILLWFMYPNSQNYGAAVLYPTPDGNHLRGTYMYGGDTGTWELTYIQ